MNQMRSANSLTNILENIFFVDIEDVAPPGGQLVVAQSEWHLNNLPLESVLPSSGMYFNIEVINKILT